LKAKRNEYQREIEALHEALGISASQRRQFALPLQFVPDELVSAGLDCFGRPQRLTKAALAAWTAMQADAARQGVELLLVSAFRSPRYQHDLIARKLARGQTLEQILKVNAAPGHSEHHTGRALDIGTPGCEPLSEEFEHTPAFHWLAANAKNHSWQMSYPRNNPWKISYEPWHWCYHPP